MARQLQRQAVVSGRSPSYAIVPMPAAMRAWLRLEGAPKRSALIRHGRPGGPFRYEVIDLDLWARQRPWFDCVVTRPRDQEGQA